jgi:hypothetical protein
MRGSNRDPATALNQCDSNLSRREICGSLNHMAGLWSAYSAWKVHPVKKIIQLTETVCGQDKRERYEWGPLDDEGQFMLLDKNELNVDETYQRTDDVSASKIGRITKAFSWVAFGVLLVVRRPDGTYWIYDGQHRWLATIRRSDISLVPCYVFDLNSLSDEASAFVRVNIERKPVKALSKDKALKATGEPLSNKVHDIAERLGLVFKESATKGGEIKCIALCRTYAAKNEADFTAVLTLCAELSKREDMEVRKDLMCGFWWIYRAHREWFANPVFLERVRTLGATHLTNACHKEALLQGARGERIAAYGIVNEINKGHRRKFSLE